MLNPKPELLTEFDICGELLEISRLKSGHINDTFVSRWREQSGERRYVHQRVNGDVFPDPELVMRNIVVVTASLMKASQLSLERDPEDRILTLIPTRQGVPWLVDDSGQYWRTYPFIEGTQCVDLCSSAKIAYEAGAAFGRFLALIDDIPASQLREPIPRFQDSVYRFEQLMDAIDRDPLDRASAVSAEIDFAISNRKLAEQFNSAQGSGEIRQRITHGDPKINNVLFSRASGRGVCIVDLDTCMPGTIIYDFGDLCRTSAIQSAEDEVDLSKVGMSISLFEGVCSGFLPGLAHTLTAFEVEHLYLAPKLLTLNIGVRFLTDYINGDRYFRIHRPSQNLDRARAQFQGVRSMAASEAEMREVVRTTLQRL